MLTDLIRFERRTLIWWGIGVISVGWLIGAAIFQLTRLDAPTYPDNSYEKRLAACSELRTSQARYDCTSDLMLARDQRVFSRVLFVLLPPLVILGTAGAVALTQAARREQARRREAYEHARARIAEHHAEMRRERDDAAAGIFTEETFLDDNGEPVETPKRFRRWR